MVQHSKGVAKQRTAKQRQSKAKQGKAINPRWEAFKNNLLLGMGKQEAYEAVEGFKANGLAAAASATRLLNNAKFKELYRRDLQKLKVNALLTKERVLLEELRIAHADIAGLFEGETTIHPSKLPKDIRRAISAVSIREVEKDGEIQRFFKYRFWNKGQALERLERHLGLFKEDNEQKGGDGVSIQVLVINEKE